GLAPIDSAAVLQGPSGTVVRSGLAGGVVAHSPLAYSAPLATSAPYLHGGIVAAGPVAYAAVPAGSGLEGQWIPDINEKLYDDGSYKPHIYGF
uniref:Cuticle structural protein PCP9.2, post-ecdysial n=1 Tax=Tenebrio molitor TaxID=7067 RepID=Q7M478_TENMO